MPTVASSQHRNKRLTRLAFEAVEPSASVAAALNHLSKAPKGRLLLSGGQAGDRYFFACRLANERGAPLAEIEVSKYIGETEKNLRRVVADARAQDAILLFDEADALFTKRGTAPSRRTRAGQNAAYLLQTARRYAGPVLFSTTASGAVLDALEKQADVVVEFGLARAVRDRPVTAQNFRVFVGGNELGICQVIGLGLRSQAAGADDSAGEAVSPPSVRLRRAVGASRELFSWYEARRGKDGRRDVRIELLDGPDGEPVVAWLLAQARPLRWAGPTLDGAENTIAMEELEIAFEQLQWH